MELNPFLSIWNRPKETVRQFINYNKLRLSIFILIISGIGGVLTALQDSGFFSGLSPLLFTLGVIIAGVISGLLNLGINTLLYTGIGKLYGGQGKLRDMAIAIGPMMIPQLFLLPVLILYVLIYGNHFFEAPADFSITTLPLAAYLLLMLLIGIASIWSMVISAKAIGVVHGFSSWRGFGVIMTIVGIVIVLAILFMIVTFVFIF